MSLLQCREMMDGRSFKMLETSTFGLILYLYLYLHIGWFDTLEILNVLDGCFIAPHWFNGSMVYYAILDVTLFPGPATVLGIYVLVVWTTAKKR